MFTILKFSFFALLLSAIPVSAQPSKRVAGSLNTYTTKIVPLVIVGEGWSQKIILNNVDKWSTKADISFFTRDGQPWAVNVKGVGTFSKFTISIPVSNSLVLELPPDFGVQRLGWARIEQYTTGNTSGGDYSGIGDTFGQIVFRKQSPGLPDFMCSMPLSMTAYRKMTTYFDNTGGNYTGLGVLTSDTSSSTSAVALRITVRDINDTIVNVKTIQQKHKTLYWMNLGADFPETVGRSGTFEVEPVDIYSTTLTGFSLQFAGNGAFTVITPFED